MLKPEILPLLQCPECERGALRGGEGGLVCQHCAASFPVHVGRPVLIRHDNALFDIQAYAKAPGTAPYAGLARFIPSPSVNLSSTRILGQMRARLDANGASRILVIGGGRQKRWLDRLLVGTVPHAVLYSDVDTRAEVDVFCDGHQLPFQEGAFDAVVITAVIAFVLSPERVAAEIARVLRPEGLLYSEVPFVQQVVEGAYDFTRHTLSGHRRLFSAFREIEAGLVAGPATVLVWAIENFAISFATRRWLRMGIKALIRVLFGWIKYCDLLLARNPSAMDGASCTFFFGARSSRATSDAEIVQRYVGNKHLEHV